MITVPARRVDAICGALMRARDGWPAVARALPEFSKLSLGKPRGIGAHRPWVLLAGEHEDFEQVPLRLVLFENGLWALKWTRVSEVQEWRAAT